MTNFINDGRTQLGWSGARNYFKTYLVNKLLTYNIDTTSIYIHKILLVFTSTKYELAYYSTKSKPIPYAYLMLCISKATTLSVAIGFVNTRFAPACSKRI
jgi:hypothetical protein